MKNLIKLGFWAGIGYGAGHLLARRFGPAVLAWVALRDLDDMWDVFNTEVD
ncbi:hypothetical protein ACFY7C_19230 [Streptomyces sp. NPDC012769]|uniref:hypothetical protein n=1 Tax=Streptomyces sp. NPDC012769 TaxID=3364848 RepID=UPI003679A5E0